METIKISTISEKEINNYWNNLSSILDIEKSIINIIEENSKNIIEKKTKNNKRIILDEYITNIFFEYFKNNKTDKIKSFIKNILRKEFLLKNKDLILFAKWKIYIIITSNDKRFNWIDEENIDLILHEFLKNFEQNIILNKVIQNIELKKYTKNELNDFISNNYNKIIFNEYVLVLQDLIQEIKEDINIDIEAIQWIVWKLFRDNYNLALEELAKYFSNYILNIRYIKDKVIKKISKTIDFTNKNVDFLKINENLYKNINKEIIKIINKELIEKTWTWVKNFFIELISKNININYIINEIFKKISENILNEIENNFKDSKIIKNIEAFLSYYSWKVVIEINWKISNKIKYPELSITWLNKAADYVESINSSNHRFILNKLIEIIKNKKRIKLQITINQKELENLKKEETKKFEKIKKLKNEIQKTGEEIYNIRLKMKKNNQNIKKLENELLKLKKLKLNEKIIQLMFWKKKKIEDKIKESLIIIKGYNEEISQLNYKIASLKQDLRYLEQHNKAITNLENKIKKLENKLQMYIHKTTTIKNSLTKDLQKRKYKI